LLVCASASRRVTSRHCHITRPAAFNAASALQTVLTQHPTSAAIVSWACAASLIEARIQASVRRPWASASSEPDARTYPSQRKQHEGVVVEVGCVVADAAAGPRSFAQPPSDQPIIAAWAWL
jgi:hypothetical protein